jgi:hypothetical protein
MSALIVETGVGLIDSNTYIDLAYLDEYASVRGFVLPTSEEEQEQFVLRAMDYLESFRGRFQGFKVNLNQACQWPRLGVMIDGFEIENNIIPEDLKRAQAQLVVEQQKRTPLFPEPLTSPNEGLVIEKQIGPLKKRFSGRSPGDNRVVNPRMPIRIASVEVFLRPLIMGIGSDRTTTYRA